MSNESNNLPADAARWGELPRAAKTVVYETLRELIAKGLREVTEIQMLHEIASHGLAKDPSPAQILKNVIVMAYELALDELEANDPELCPECGVYHDEEAPERHVHPKDLS